MQHTTTRRVLLTGALLIGAWTAAELADQASAHAADKPPKVEQPRGLIHGAGRLPEQASDRAREVVDNVKPAKPEPTEPEKPAPKPEPAPADEPIVKVPPVVVTPAPDPIAVTLPAVDPSPLPDGDAPALAVPAIPAAPPVSALELLTGPVASTRTVHLDAPARTNAAVLMHILCGDEDPLDVTAPTAPVKRIKRDHPRPAAIDRHEHPPCDPGTPSPHIVGVVSVKPPPTPAADMVTADNAAAQPLLVRLDVLRARSHLPTGRTVHLDPRPA